MLHDERIFGRRAGCFTLQWHLTHACEGHCAHCYDRRPLGTLSLPDARAVVAELAAFCRRRRIAGQVCFTGGNPFLYPHFSEIYREVAAQGFRISILTNPVARSQIAEIAAIARPTYVQISLEGRAAHNDAIRGDGHYERSVAFLRTLSDLEIRAHVMLTLTRANLAEVLPLGEALRTLADRFTFNRLAQVGGGAALSLPTRDEYVALLEQYLVSSRTNPVLGFKDNLFNIFRYHFGRPLYGGCTGFGCGAAFNFIALLPNGEAHGCRKFPSPLGHVLAVGLEGVYRSPAARRYRRGSSACRWCRIRNRCGGCLAVTYGQGGDVFRDPDPHCFWPERARYLASA